MILRHTAFAFFQSWSNLSVCIFTITLQKNFKKPRYHKLVQLHLDSKYLITMKTRRQLKAEQEQSVKGKSKTKKQLLNEKIEKEERIKGQKVAEKKRKKNESPAQKKNTKRQTRKPTRVSAKSVSSPKKQKKKQPVKKRGKSVKPQSQSQSQSQSEQELVKIPKRKTAKLQTKEDEQQSASKNIKKLQFKGKVPIDDFWPMNKSKYHVYCADKIYSSTLNQTKLGANANKFYIIQIMQSDTNGSDIWFYTRWGRVGKQGQMSNEHMGLNEAIRSFEKKFREKNIKGDYRQLDINYGEDQEQQQKKEEQQSRKDIPQKPKIESKLSKPVKQLIQLIFDINMMKEQMKQIGYDIKKMPLGKLSKNNIQTGYDTLKQLLDEIQGSNRRNQIVRLTEDFYSFIPHDFGFKNMMNFLLEDEKKVKAKLQMLEALAEIKVATKLLSDTSEDQVNKLDSNYNKLNRTIDSIPHKSDEFETINNYLQSTHAKTHGSYSLELIDLFKLRSQTQDMKFTNDIGNRMLLWHGSRLTNFVGILSQGLRIAPPEAPVTGYMFGKGVYFADMSSKSANYCCPSNNTGILLLCEVALGGMQEYFGANYYASNLPENKQSTLGVGKTAPPKENYIKLDGVTIPMGPGENTNAVSSLLYNEYIVYDIAQIKIKYLLRLKWKPRR